MSRALVAALAGLLLLPATGAAITDDNNRDVKILGGGVAAPGQFPFMAVLVDSSAQRAIHGAFCGGSGVAPPGVPTPGALGGGPPPDENERGRGPPPPSPGNRG